LQAWQLLLRLLAQHEAVLIPFSDLPTVSTTPPFLSLVDQGLSLGLFLYKSFFLSNHIFKEDRFWVKIKNNIHSVTFEKKKKKSESLPIALQWAPLLCTSVLVSKI